MLRIPTSLGQTDTECIRALQVYLYTLAPPKQDPTKFYSFPKSAITGSWNEDTNRILDLHYGSRAAWANSGGPCNLLTNVKTIKSSTTSTEQKFLGLPIPVAAVAIGVVGLVLLSK